MALSLPRRSWGPKAKITSKIRFGVPKSRFGVRKSRFGVPKSNLGVPKPNKESKKNIINQRKLQPDQQN